MTDKLIFLLNFGLVESYLAADEFMQSDTSGWQRHGNALSLTHCVKLKKSSSFYHRDGTASISVSLKRIYP